jgi:hypothetical protein
MAGSDYGVGRCEPPLDVSQLLHSDGAFHFHRCRREQPYSVGTSYRLIRECLNSEVTGQ